MREDLDSILFLDQTVQVVRKYRARRLTLSIRPDRPMRVTSNITTSPSEILNFLNSNLKWIQKNLAKLEEFNKNFQMPKLEESSLFPFLGELKYFIFAKSEKARISFTVEDGFLICKLPKNKIKEQIPKEVLEKALQQFYKSEAIAYLAPRVQRWVTETGLKPIHLKYGRATTRWGSCNSKKHIVLNWKLICHAPSLIDYVIVHELCHLRFLNHSDQFWNLVSSYMPEYLTYEKTLNNEVSLSRFLN